MAPPALQPALSPDRHPPAPTPPSPEEAEFERAMVKFFSEAAEVLGLPRSVAAIYAVIFASPRPLCFADVESRLQLSKGSVSQGLRFLRDIGAIKPAEANERTVRCRPQATGGRREALSDGVDAGPAASNKFADFPISRSPDLQSPRRPVYVPDMELRRLAARLLKKKIEPQLNGNDRRLAELAASVPFADREESRLVRTRLKHLQSWHHKARRLVPFAKTILALG